MPPFMLAASPHHLRPSITTGRGSCTDHSAAPVAVRPLGDAAQARQRFEGGSAAVATHMIERNLTEVRSILIGLGDFKAHMTVRRNVQPCAQRNAHAQWAGLPQPLPEGADSWVSCRGRGGYSSLPRLRVISSGLPPTGTHRLKSHHLRSATVDPSTLSSKSGGWVRVCE
jgi:hypothetical protein